MYTKYRKGRLNFFAKDTYAAMYLLLSFSISFFKIHLDAISSNIPYYHIKPEGLMQHREKESATIAIARISLIVTESIIRLASADSKGSAADGLFKVSLILQRLPVFPGRPPGAAGLRRRGWISCGNGPDFQCRFLPEAGHFAAPLFSSGS